MEIFNMLKVAYIVEKSYVILGTLSIFVCLLLGLKFIRLGLRYKMEFVMALGAFNFITASIVVYDLIDKAEKINIHKVTSAYKKGLISEEEFKVVLPIVAHNASKREKDKEKQK